MVTVNNEQRLYVIPSGSGYSCLGFDNCLSQATVMRDRMGLTTELAAPGDLKLYEQYRELLGQYGKHPASQETWFDPGTDEAVKATLRYSIRADVRLRLFYGDPDTGRDWCEEYDVMGTIGRSTGVMKVPLLIHNRRSMGGGAILTANILRIISIKSRRELYRHPKYQMPEFEIVPETETGLIEKGYHFIVKRDSDNVARFQNEEKAQNFIKFMRGEVFRY